MALLGAARVGLRRLGVLPLQSLALVERLRVFSAASGPAGKAPAKGEDAAPAPEISLGRFTAEKDDIVLTSFKQFQAAYRGLLEGLKDIPLPLKGDDAAVKKFAQKVEALKRKVKYPDGEAMDEVEKEAGPPIASNRKAADMLTKKLKVIKDEYGLGKVSKEEAKLEMYKKQLKDLREKVEEDIEVVKRREGLEFVNIDPASLRLRW
ncbi:hypothetical protein WJX81_000374 [Elliptochloris bilobata]|uniref:ATP synthase 24 kDa subunit, mitochondrial n=1 Tax=Elliptochloris bilobata TaxID=381761 RepID=A0AAW1QM84_9CHLO